MQAQMQEFLEVLKSYTSWYLWQGQISVNSFDLFCKAYKHVRNCRYLDLMARYLASENQWMFQVLDVGLSW